MSLQARVICKIWHEKQYPDLNRIVCSIIRYSVFLLKFVFTFVVYPFFKEAVLVSNNVLSDVLGVYKGPLPKEARCEAMGMRPQRQFTVI